MVIITLYNSKVLLSLHYFLTPQFQTFTNLLNGIFGVSNPTYFYEIGRNYVFIIVNIISNYTVLQCYLLWIFVSIRLLQLIVCIGISTPSHLKNIIPSFFFFFAKPSLRSANYPSPLFRRFTPLQKKLFFHAPPPPLLKIGFFSELSQY